MLPNRNRDKGPKPVKSRREGYKGERDKKLKAESKRRAENKTEKPVFEWKGLKHFLDTFK